MSLSEEERAKFEHNLALQSIREILSLKEGKFFFKYLFKHFEVGELHEFFYIDDVSRERLGFLKAGNSIFSLVSQASPEQAGKLLAEKEKERHDRQYIESLDEDGSDHGV